MKQNKDSEKKGLGKHMHLSWTELIVGVAIVLIGLVLLIWPDIATSLLFSVIGAVCIIIGMVYVVRSFMLRRGSPSPASICRWAWCGSSAA